MASTKIRKEQISSGAADDGDVFTADGAGATDWEAPAAGGGNFTLISSTTVTGSAAANITLSNIPGTYKSLMLIYTLRASDGTGGKEYFWCQFNGDTSTNYNWAFDENTGSSANDYSATGQSAGYLGYMPDNGAAAGLAGSGQAIFPHYANTAFHKTWLVTARGDNVNIVENIAGRWANTNAITSILMFFGSSRNIAIGSQVDLYGLS